MGPTRRRHVVAVAVECIGKESEGYGGPEVDDEEAPLEYALSDETRHKLALIVASASLRHGQREYRAEAKVSDRTLREAARADPKIGDAVLLRLVEVADLLDHRASLSEDEVSRLLEFARERRAVTKLAVLSRRLGENEGNVSQVLNGKRRPYPRFLRAVQRLMMESDDLITRPN